ncbi:MAG TPA: ATP-binding cassette domain-containing protein, partial [Acidimicrobiales bacterium]
MTPVLELDGVTCRFGDGRATATALDGVSLAVRPGELVAVMGPSGSGKSTLVHVACGLVAPTAGTVRIGGEAPGRRPRRWWTAVRRTTVGVVHQRLNLLPGLTALDNVALPLRLDGRRVSASRREAAERLTQVGAAALAS